MLYGSRTSARQTDIERIDTERFHQMQDLYLLFNRGIANRGRLQAIPQGFIR